MNRAAIGWAKHAPADQTERGLPMTPFMQWRWLFTITAAVGLAILVLSPDILLRLTTAFWVPSWTIQATLSWRDYLEWREFWLLEQQKGMPE